MQDSEAVRTGVDEIPETVVGDEESGSVESES